MSGGGKGLSQPPGPRLQPGARAAAEVQHCPALPDDVVLLLNLLRQWAHCFVGTKGCRGNQAASEARGRASRAP